MPTKNEPKLLTFKDWTFRLRPSKAKSTRLLVSIHGWTGDENSMWLLTRNISPSFTIIAPRGTLQVPEGGYSWREIKPGTWGIASLEDFHPAAEALLSFVNEWSESAEVDTSQFDVLGFSQGAAMAFTLAILHPERIRRLVILSGFIPECQ